MQNNRSYFMETNTIKYRGHRKAGDEERADERNLTRDK